MSTKPPTRRQQKLMRIIKEAVSDIIQNRLNDPRIEGFVTVTEVDLSPDIRNADIYVSVMSDTEAKANKTLIAVQHATKHIQTLLAERLTTRFVPILRIHKDVKLKKTLDTLHLIEEAAKEYKDKEILDTDQESEDERQ